MTAVFLSHHGHRSISFSRRSTFSSLGLKFHWNQFPLGQNSLGSRFQWKQNFIGINFHWNKIHWEQNSTGSNFAGSKRQWGSSVALTPCYLFCPSGWQPQVQLPRDICLHLASTVRTPTRRNQRLQIAPWHCSEIAYRIDWLRACSDSE